MSGIIGSMVTILLQAYFFDMPQSMGYQACNLETTWPGTLEALAGGNGAEDSDSEDEDDNDNGKEKLRRPFIERVPLSTWSATHTHVSDLMVLSCHSAMISHIYYLVNGSNFERTSQSGKLG